MLLKKLALTQPFFIPEVPVTGGNNTAVFGGIDKLLSDINTSLTAILGTITTTVVLVGLIAIAALSIMTMFCDEQQAQRYKRWRTNVFKAILIVGLAGGLLTLVAGILSAANLWIKPGQVTNSNFFK